MRASLWSIFMLLVLLVASACGGGAPPRGTQSAAEPPPEAIAPEPPPPPPSTQGEIPRVALAAVLDAGLGRFLQGVETEPELDGGRFVGFRIVSLYPDDERMRAVDLAPGDVVISVNGLPIERPEQAMHVWSSLRVVSELLIDYRRDGAERQLRFAIVD